jgi:hypothetical protein
MSYGRLEKKILPGLSSRCRLWAKRLNANFLILPLARAACCKSTMVGFLE